MTLAFITYKPSRRFIARIKFQSVRILQGISCPVVWNVYSRGVNGKEVILRIFLPRKLSNDSERRAQVYTSFQSTIAGFTLFV